MAPKRKASASTEAQRPDQGERGWSEYVKDGSCSQGQAVDNRCAIGQDLHLWMEALDGGRGCQVAGSRQNSKHSGGQTQEDLSGGHVVPFPEKEGSWEGKHTVETEAEAEKSGSQLLPGDWWEK